MELTLDGLENLADWPPEALQGAALRVRGLALPYLEGLERGHHYRQQFGDVEDYPLELNLDEWTSPTEVATAIKAFACLTDDDRQRHTRHVHAYYQEMDAATDGEINEGIDPPIASPENVWSHVWLHSLSVCDAYKPIPVFIVANFGCAWEQEHGMTMSFEAGTTLVRVGGINGHMYNSRRSSGARSPMVRSALVHAGRRFPTE